MKLVRGAWRILVGIKDALVLVAMLLFFGVLFAALAARPGAAPIRDGALVLDLDGTIVEQPQDVSPLALLSGGDTGPHEFRLRDLVRALDAARTDDRVKAVVLDLDRFAGGYPASVNEVGAALRRVRDAKKPVLAYATAYTDSGYRLAANASEIWVSPLGGSLFLGPGGNQLYYKGLLDKLGVTAHVYRVGKFKSAVEPFIRSDASPESKAAIGQVYAQLFGNWQQVIREARPKAQIAAYVANPVGMIAAAGGDVAQANLRSGIVDRLGDRYAFGRRVAEIAGAEPKDGPGSFREIRYDNWVDAHPLPDDGAAVGVLTIAGDIMDGRSRAGMAGGDTIARTLTDRLAKGDLKALVVRVDSPGGSVPASEEIRTAILQAKAKGLPVVVSMGGIAASGGYWVSTPADAILAEPTTLTGSIGVFGILPTFEKTLSKLGITSDGVRTTPLSGQPDLYAGTTPEFDALAQAGIDQAYAQFLGHVARARRMPVARVDQIAQGRVWTGAMARQLGLIDRFGNLDDAVAEAARRAKLPKFHAAYLEKPKSQFARAIEQYGRDEEEAAGGTDALSRVAAERRGMFVQALGDARRLVEGSAVQARCLECAGFGGAALRVGDASLFALVLAKLGL